MTATGVSPLPRSARRRPRVRVDNERLFVLTESRLILWFVEKRFQVFVSSTYADLAEERAEVVSMLLNLDALSAGMELFPATNDDAWTLIQRVIDESDYYLLAIGGRYGSVDEETNLSYTEKEFDYAVEQKKPVMAFLHGDPGKIPSEKTDQNDAAREKLNAFRAKVEKAVHVNYWSGASELSGHVAKSFVKLQKSHPATGWVRGDVQTSTESLEELNALRKRLEETERQLADAREGPPPGTEDLAQGAETFVADVYVRATVETTTWNRHHPQFAVPIESTWDELFAEVGPLMLDEANQNSIEQRLDRWFFGFAYDEGVEKLEGWIKSQNLSVSEYDAESGSITTRDFDTILLQLRALGLITKSQRNRSVKDTATYWKLTPYGDARLTALRAIRKGEASVELGGGPAE
jgi:hypothetical protein